MLRAIPVSLVVLAAGGIAGCATNNDQPQRTAQASAPIAVPVKAEPGVGVVTQVFMAPPYADPGAGPRPGRYQRLEVRMESGRMQFVDVPITDAIGEFARGMRVQITESGTIRQL